MFEKRATSRSVENARAQALLLLKFRPRSESELSRRLSAKGFELKIVQAVLAEFKQKGLVDDTKLARYFATQKIFSSPVGRRALESSLRAKGIEPQLAAEAAGEALAGTDELENARALALKRVASMKGIKSDAVLRRLFGFLSRRGFSNEVVYRVLREVRERSGPFTPYHGSPAP